MEEKNKKDINRRDFIKIVGISAATSTGLLYGCSSKGTTSASSATGEGEVPTDKMTYRTSPTTGDRVSLLGYGCMRWPLKPAPDGNGEVIDQDAVNGLIDYAIAHGVNYFDTSPAYVQGFSEKATGIALSRHPRDKYYIATKLSNFSPDTWSREASLKMYHKSFAELQVDYIDYMLNLAQSFNPMGSLLGMYVAMQFIQAKLHPMCTEDRALLNDSEFQAIKESDLSVLIAPYLIIGLVIVAMLLLIRFVKMPKNGDQNHRIDFFPTLKRIFTQTRYREGVIAQFFYVGAQIMCWTFIIQYGTRLFMSQGMDEKSAEVLSQQYNIVAMVIFCISRFICTFILRYLNAGKLLMILAIFGGVFTLGTIFLQNIFGLYCLVAVSACMSLMFPTIYGIALKGMGDDAKFGAAGLIMAILGGSVLPPLQASIIDLKQIAWLPAVNVSFILPFICFLVIIGYGYRTVKRNW